MTRTVIIDGKDRQTKQRDNKAGIGPKVLETRESKKNNIIKMANCLKTTWKLSDNVSKVIRGGVRLPEAVFFRAAKEYFKSAPHANKFIMKVRNPGPRKIALIKAMLIIKPKVLGYMGYRKILGSLFQNGSNKFPAESLFAATLQFGQKKCTCLLP